MSDTYDLALYQARHALDDQARGLERLRDRSMALLVLSGVAAMLTDHPLSYAALLLLAGWSADVAWPRKFTFVQDAGTLVQWVEMDLPGKEMTRDLALHMNRHHNSNGAKIRKLLWLYRLSLIVFAAQVVGLVAVRLQ